MANNLNVTFNSSNAPQLKDFQNDIPAMQQKEYDEHIEVEELKSMIYTLLTETDCERDDKLRKCKNYAELRGKYQKKYEGLMMRYPSLYNMVLVVPPTISFNILITSSSTYSFLIWALGSSKYCSEFILFFSIMRL